MNVAYQEIAGTSWRYRLLVAALAAVVASGLVAALYMEDRGHIVTGMTNQVVWGLPHVFAVFLIVAASGAMNVASIASVFGRTHYKPLAPLSGLVAVALLAGGLAVLVLDLGRPDRLIVAMTHFNFSSIFAWNVFLYSGFLGIVTVYLWMMMERRMNHFSGPVGLVAFLWRLALTTGTGSIFGFLVARSAFDSALFAPMFIVMSLSYGLAVYLLILVGATTASGRPLGHAITARLAGLLSIFVAAVLYFVLVYHLTGLYMSRRHAVEDFLLVSGGIYPVLFWAGQITLGSLVPLALLLSPGLRQSRLALVWAAALVVLGALCQMYVTIIGGQALPLILFPGHAVSSSFFDGVIHGYQPSLPEVLLGVGGLALAVLIVTLGVKLLRFLPVTLADEHLGAELGSAAAASAPLAGMHP